MVILQNKEECTGCSACYTICPQKAIDMNSDKEGFLYPHINEQLCIHCNRCKKACPVEACHQKSRIQNGKFQLADDGMAYAAFNKNDDERMPSSSGGIFYALSRDILARGGIIFGACFDKEFRLYHGKAETMEELKPFIGSKYVQSRIGDCFIEVRKHLEMGREVLFAGTMCQIEGLLAILPTNLHRNLYCVDLICMGIPSPDVWDTYKDTLSQQGEIKFINFKSKVKGWKNFHLHIQYQGKNVYEEGMRNAYMQTFFRGYNMRPSCFYCEYKKKPRKSDITLADCWGIDQLAPDINDNKGCSTLVIHTDKGQQLFTRVQAGFIFREVTLENALAKNQYYYECRRKPLLRTLFWWMYSFFPHTAIRIFGNTVGLSLKSIAKKIMLWINPQRRMQ